MSRTTQKDLILKFMDDFGWITPMDAIYEIGCTKLSTRIGELIRDGVKIEKAVVYGKNRWGKAIHYMKYRRAA